MFGKRAIVHGCMSCQGNVTRNYTMSRKLCRKEDLKLMNWKFATKLVNQKSKLPSSSLLSKTNSAIM